MSDLAVYSDNVTLAKAIDAMVQAERQIHDLANCRARGCLLMGKAYDTKDPHRDTMVEAALDSIRTAEAVTSRLADALREARQFLTHGAKS